MSAPTRKSKKFGSGVPMGTPSMDLDVYDRTFKVRGQYNGVKLIQVISRVDGMADGKALGEILDFIESALLTEEREAAMTFFRESDPPVTFPMLVEIFQWLISEYTGNPTEPDSPSTTGSSIDGPGFSENAPSPEQTSATLTGSSFGPSEQPSLLAP